jgi:dTDP-4-amino-4,6-dideoxy-D-galactose acyltransferase
MQSSQTSKLPALPEGSKNYYKFSEDARQTSTKPDGSILTKLTHEEYDAFESKIDTDYFGIRTAKVFLKKACVLEKRQNDLLTFLSDFEFSSITNRSNDAFNNRWLGEKTTAFLTDMNMQFTKKVSTSEKINGGMAEITDNLPANPQIVEIAENSFVVSQFLNDPYLPGEKARCIYGDIAKNAFGKPGRFFSVIKSEEAVKGCLLFSLNHSSSTAIIELLVINQIFQGQGIGKALVASLESYVSGKGIQAIKVGTQANNTTALNFYTSYGFKYLECNSIYHFWHLKG